MKTEKELKEEIEEVKHIEMLSKEGEQNKRVRLARLKAQLKTLKERNAEIKQAINEVFFKERYTTYCGFEGWLREDIQTLLQKLGLDEQEGDR